MTITRLVRFESLLRSTALSAALAVLLWPSTGLAQQGGEAAEGKSKTRGPRGAVLLDAITITGRLTKPLAAVDILKVPTSMALSELKQPFLKRVEAAIYKDPF